MRSQVDILTSLIVGIENKTDTKIAKGSDLYNTLWEMSVNMHSLYMQADKYTLSTLLEFMPNESFKILDQEVSLLSSRGSELELKRKDAVPTTIFAEAEVLNIGILNKGFKVKYEGVDFLLDDTVDLTALGPIELQFTSELVGSESNIIRINDTLEVSESTLLIEESLTCKQIVEQGKDQETVDNFRERIIQKERQPQQGGAYADFVNWAELSGDFVFNATAYTNITNPGQVDIYIETNYKDVLGVPTADEIQIVHDYFYNDNFLPLNTAVKIEPITRDEVVVQVTANGTALSTDGRENINRALKNLVYSKRPYLLGQSRTPENAELSLAELYATTGLIVANFGGKLTSVTATINGNPLDVVEVRFEKRYFIDEVSFVVV